MAGRHKKYLRFINDVFGKAKSQLNISSDAELAKYLYENRGNLAKYRTGERIINDWKLLKACTAAGVELSEALNMILRYKSLRLEAREMMLKLVEALKKEESKDTKAE